MTRPLAITLNALGLYGVAFVLMAAFAAQLSLGELPCPLCLIQRIQFALLAVGPILNVRFGPRPSHYAVSLLTAAAGAAFASRQVLLHIMPGDAGYGSALLGYHYYTWASSASSLPSLRSRSCCCSTRSSRTSTRRKRPAVSRAQRCGWCWRSPPST